LCRAGAFLSTRSRNRDMQLKAVIPDQFACAALFQQAHPEDERGTPAPHRQHDAPPLSADRLSRPGQWVVALIFPGVTAFAVDLAQVTHGINVGKEGMTDHLYRLTTEGKLAFGGLLQFISVRPARVLLASRQMDVSAERPDSRRFHLGFPQACPIAKAQACQAIDTHRLHLPSHPSFSQHYSREGGWYAGG